MLGQLDVLYRKPSFPAVNACVVCMCLVRVWCAWCVWWVWCMCVLFFWTYPIQSLITWLISKTTAVILILHLLLLLLFQWIKLNRKYVGMSYRYNLWFEWIVSDFNFICKGKVCECISVWVYVCQCACVCVYIGEN